MRRPTVLGARKSMSAAASQQKAARGLRGGPHKALLKARSGRPSRVLGWLPYIVLGVDVLAISAALILAAVGRDSLPLFATTELSPWVTAATPLIGLGWLLVLAATGSYQRRVFDVGTDEYKRVLNATLVTAGLVGITSYLLRFQLSRGFFVLAFVLGPILLVTGRYVVRHAIHRSRSRGRALHRVVIAGSASHVDEIARVLSRETWLGYDVVGALTPRPAGSDSTPGGVPVLGTAESLRRIADEVHADVVFLAGGAFDSARDLRTMAWDLESEDLQIVVAPGVTDVAGERIQMRPVGGLPLIHLEKPRSARALRLAKRSFDVAVSLVLLVVTAPVVAYAGLRVWLHDRGPILFRQVRVGHDGEQFSCLKLRTMVPDAEAHLAELQQEQSYDGGLFKVPQDPRITPPGQWLRRFSIDELPQLVNVLRGDMSLVGPRPPLPDEVEQYDEAMRRRLRVRPGMTGLWQISGRSDLAWDEAIRLDLYYVDNWSMLQDLVILARTVGAVLKGNGAY
jgi:exopolysaccharide biosynthesis polyprenyl glycosylphosphotransferase